MNYLGADAGHLVQTARPYCPVGRGAAAEIQRVELAGYERATRRGRPYQSALAGKAELAVRTLRPWAQIPYAVEDNLALRTGRRGIERTENGIGDIHRLDAARPAR